MTMELRQHARAEVDVLRFIAAHQRIRPHKRGTTGIRELAALWYRVRRRISQVHAA